MRLSRRSFAQVPRPLLFAAILTSALGLLSPNPLLTAAGAWLAPVLFMLLWRPGEPPVLLLGAAMQWLAVYLPVMSANLAGEEIGAFYYLPTMESAAWLGLLAVLVVALGMRVGVGRRSLIDSEKLDWSAAQLDPRRLMLAYLLAFGFSLLIPSIAALSGGARQLVLPLGELRWILGFMVLWSAARGAIPKTWAGLLVLLELLVGFGSFFGGFKLIVLLTVLAVLAGGGFRVRVFRPAVVALFLLALSLGIFWQAIKVDYRAFLNQGTGMQVVLVSPGARANFVLTQAMDLDSEDLARGVETMISRLGYLEYLARSIGQVPEVIPYQNGRLLAEVFQHVFMPRLFFPDKPAINDSDRTNEFTGIRVAGAAQGTSIGIGYAAESYIDFGPLLMFAPIFFYGWFWGWGYRYLVLRSRLTFLSAATAVAFLMPSVTYFEQSNLKLLGGGIVSLIVLSLLLRFVGPSLWRYLTKGRSSAAVRRRSSAANQLPETKMAVTKSARPAPPGRF